MTLSTRLGHGMARTNLTFLHGIQWAAWDFQMKLLKPSKIIARRFFTSSEADSHGESALTKIVMPRCKFCGAEDPHRCYACGEWTCFECIIFQTGEACQHGRYEPFEANNWQSGDELPKAGNTPLVPLSSSSGCPCACHRPGEVVHHVMPCHVPLLVYGEGPIRWY